MFKGKILQFTDTEAIVLSDTLKYEKIKLKSQMEIGQNIFYFDEDIIMDTDVSPVSSLLERMSSIKFYYGLAPVLAVLLLVIMIYNNSINSSPVAINTYGVISIDINPSISLLVNEEGFIEHTEGKNEDGVQLLSSLSLVGKSIHTAIETIIVTSEESGYLEENSQIFIATTEQSIEHHIDDLVISVLEDLESDDLYTVYLADVDYDLYKESEIEKVSLGHYYLDSKTDAVDDSLFSPERIKQIISEDNKIKQRKPSNINPSENKETHKETIQDKKDEKTEEKIEKKETHEEKQENKLEEKLEKKEIREETQDNKLEEKLEQKLEHKDSIQEKKDEKSEEKIEKKDDALDDKLKNDNTDKKNDSKNNNNKIKNDKESSEDKTEKSNNNSKNKK